MAEGFKKYYGENFIGFLVYEIVERELIGVLLVLKRRSPLMIDDSLRAMQFVKFIYPEAKSVSVITLDELKEKLKEKRDEIKDFLTNIVYIHDEFKLLKPIIEEAQEE